MRKLRGLVRTKRTTPATSSRLEREVRGHAAWADVRAADAALAQLMVERAREADLGELRRAVDRLERKASPPGLGRERDDVRLPAFEQVRQGGAHGVERSFHVHVDHLFEEIRSQLEKGTIGAHARI